MRIAFFILWLLHFLPVTWTHALARFLSKIAYPLAKSRRHVGEVNLRLCFPEKSEEERKHILQEHFYHMLAMILDYSYCWYASNQKISQLVDYQNKEILDNALQSGQKVILFYPHYCSLEMGVAKLNQNVPLISVYSHQKNKTLDERILKGRHRYNNVFLLGRTDGLLGIIRAIKKRNEPFLYLPDQDFGEKDSIFVPFFGVSTATTDGLSRIAKLTKSVIIPMIPKRLENGRYVLTFYPAWENFPTNDVYADTTRMNAFLEERIREFPEQYYWLHKRFKTRPQGESSVY